MPTVFHPQRTARPATRRAATALFHLALLICVGLRAEGARAGSIVALPHPEMGVFVAGTYDDLGERLGDSRFELTRLGDGRIHMVVYTGIEGGARNEAHATFVQAPDGLRVIEQSSESHDPKGNSLGVMRVDHLTRRATCTPPGGSEDDAPSLQLPERDRVMNVPLNLLFSPLARGNVEAVEFQLFLCRSGSGPRLMDFEAVLVPRVDAAPEDRIVEIQYSPDLGFVNWVAGSLIPKLSFWMNPDGGYLAHRIPIYTDGPEVMVVRDGISPYTLTPLSD